MPPSDARFCHKCGRPLFEEDAARLEELRAPVPPPPPPPSPRDVISQRISFRNTRALGVSITLAAAAFFGIGLIGKLIPMGSELIPVLLLAGAGFAGPVIYTKRSRRLLSPGEGAKLGWMIGFWILLAFLLAATGLALALSGAGGPELLQKVQELAQQSHLPIKNAGDMATLALGTIVQMFFFILFSIFGGMIGARFVSRNQPSA